MEEPNASPDETRLRLVAELLHIDPVAFRETAPPNVDFAQLLDRAVKYRREHPPQPGDVTPGTPSARRLADALAKRLNAVLPTPFRAVAHGGELDFLEGESYWMTKSCGVVEEDLDEDEVSYLALADNAVTSALSAVQDVVARATHNPWPMDATGGMAMPSTRIEGTALHLSYGDALVLEPLDLADFLN